ncbi:anticodon-binding aminoacyl-tRNA synthetase, class 1a [Tanacetum coccineum]
MHMGHLRSTFIGEALACMLEYSGVVLQKRIHDVNHLEIKGKSSDDPIRKTLDLLREMGSTTVSNGDEAVYLTTLRHALYTEKADGILYVTDVGQRDYIGMCISAAKRAGWLTEDHSEYLLSHVGFGHVQFDDLKRLRTLSTKVDNLVGLLDEAKSCCKALLVGQGMADGWTAEDLDHAAEALGYGVVKYVYLKNNRLANYTFDFDQMLNKEAEELVLKNDDERELGLHLLRFTEVLKEVCTILAPHVLCEYLYVLCVKFNNLNVCEVGGSSDETSRLLLCEAAEVVVRKCFDLLGIAPINLLEHFHMDGAKDVITPLRSDDTLSLVDGSKLVDPTPYRRLVGSLQYLAITRPDVSFTRGSPLTLTAFSDSDWGGIKDGGRSTTAYVLYLGPNIIS